MATSTKSTDHTVQFRDALESGAERSKEVLETFSAAANEATHAVQDCCTIAVKGMQNYSEKIIQFTQDNIKSHVEFGRKLAGAKSPSEFIELSTSHARHQVETLAQQSKELATLAQQVTRDTVEPLTAGFAKTSIVPR